VDSASRGGDWVTWTAPADCGVEGDLQKIACPSMEMEGLDDPSSRPGCQVQCRKVGGRVWVGYEQGRQSDSSEHVRIVRGTAVSKQ
jgi:hypothetical protein